MADMSEFALGDAILPFLWKCMATNVDGCGSTRGVVFAQRLVVRLSISSAFVWESVRTNAMH